MVATVPPGARALQGGREAGTTPLPLALRAGDVIHVEKKGYRPLDYRFPGGSGVPSLTLEPLRTAETIRTFPDGATVVLDAVKLEGATPLEVKDWDQSQKHDLTCTKGDLLVSTTFSEGETPGNQVFTLHSAAETRAGAVSASVDASAPGSLRFTAPYAVRVRLDGRDLGEVREGGSLSAPPGSHRLEVTNPKVFLKEGQTVTVHPGQATSVTLPGLASLTVNSFPNSGTVVVDGVASQSESDGNSPIRMVKGRHAVNVLGRSAPPQTVDLKDDFKLNMRF